MKSLLLGLLLLSSTVFAKDVIVTSAAEDYELGRVPQNLMSVLLDQKFKQVEISKGVFEILVKDLRCDFSSRDALFPDSSIGGLPTVKCFVNAESIRNGKGKAIQDSRYIYDILNLVDTKTGAEIGDCSMGGKCSSFVKILKCQVDLNQEEMSKAYSCLFK